MKKGETRPSGEGQTPVRPAPEHAPEKTAKTIPIETLRCERAQVRLSEDGNPLLPSLDGRGTPVEAIQNIVGIQAATKPDSGQDGSISLPGLVIGQDEQYAYVAGSIQLSSPFSSRNKQITGEWYRVTLRPWTENPVQFELEPLGIAHHLNSSFFRMPVEAIKDVPALVPMPDEQPGCAKWDTVFAIGYATSRLQGDPPVIREAVVTDVIQEPERPEPTVKLEGQRVGAMLGAPVLNADGRLIGLIGPPPPPAIRSNRTIARNWDIAGLYSVPAVREAWYPSLLLVEMSPFKWDESGVDLDIDFEVLDPLHRVTHLELAIGRMSGSDYQVRRATGGYAPVLANMASVACRRPLGPWRKSPYTLGVIGRRHMRERDTAPLATWHDPRPVPPNGELKYVVQLIGTGKDGHGYRSRPEAIVPPVAGGRLEELEDFKTVRREPRGGILITPEETKVADNGSKVHLEESESIPIPKPVAYPIEFPPPESTKGFADITWFTLLGQRTYGTWGSAFAWAPDGTALFAISTANALNPKGASVVRMAVPEMTPTGLLPLPHKSTVQLAGSRVGLVVFANTRSATFVYVVDPRTLEVRKRFAVPQLERIAANLNSRYAYALESDWFFTVIDLEKSRVVRRTRHSYVSSLLNLSEDGRHLSLFRPRELMASVMEFRLEGEDVIWQGLHKRVPGDTRIDPLYAKGSKLVVHVERGSGGRTKAEVMDHNGRQIGEFAVPTTACAAAFAPGSENRLAIHGERNTCLVDLNLRDEARSRD